MLNKLFSHHNSLKVDLNFPEDNNKLSIVKNKILLETFLILLSKETDQELNLTMIKFRICIDQIVLSPDQATTHYLLCLYGS